VPPRADLRLQALRLQVLDAIGAIPARSSCIRLESGFEFGQRKSQLR
jgi:hypothetical protein